MNYNDPNDQIVKDGRVESYNSTTGVWTTLAGDISHRSIDGTQIQSITMDESGNIYAATTGGKWPLDLFGIPYKRKCMVMLGTGTLDGTSVNSVITDGI